MAQTFNIACRECGVTLWIGQRDSGAPIEASRIYNSWQHQKAQRDFFYSHIGHHLEFNDSETISFMDYDDISDYGDES